MFFNKKWDNCGCHSGIGKDGKIGNHGERFGSKTIAINASGHCFDKLTADGIIMTWANFGFNASGNTQPRDNIYRAYIQPNIDIYSDIDLNDVSTWTSLSYRASQKIIISQLSSTSCAIEVEIINFNNKIKKYNDDYYLELDFKIIEETLQDTDCYNVEWDQTSISYISLTGETGHKGIKGDTGGTGLQGPQGNKGLQGNRGPKGLQGPQGPQGPQGFMGLTGNVIRGPKGIQGPQGPQGPQGDVGLQGSIGQRGPKGIQGPQGPQRGPQGDIGLQGSIGPTGPKGIQGPQGPQGPQGDYPTISIIGPQGPRGPQGNRGEDVNSPITGPQGIEGLPGPLGPDGYQGQKGPQGDPSYNVFFDSSSNFNGEKRWNYSTIPFVEELVISKKGGYFSKKITYFKNVAQNRWPWKTAGNCYNHEIGEVIFEDNYIRIFNYPIENNKRRINIHVIKFPEGNTGGTMIGGVGAIIVGGGGGGGSTIDVSHNILLTQETFHSYDINHEVYDGTDDDNEDEWHIVGKRGSFQRGGHRFFSTQLTNNSKNAERTPSQVGNSDGYDFIIHATNGGDFPNSRHLIKLSYMSEPSEYYWPFYKISIFYSQHSEPAPIWKMTHINIERYENDNLGRTSSIKF